jgi:hypothetical protein
MDVSDWCPPEAGFLKGPAVAFDTPTTGQCRFRARDGGNALVAQLAQVARGLITCPGVVNDDDLAPESDRSAASLGKSGMA